MPRMIAVGWNRKLGPGVASFSIPAGKTCPGASEWCSRPGVCYAGKGHFTFLQNMKKYQANFESMMQPDFVERVVAEIRASNVRDFRIHVSGDFTSPFMVLKWIEVARALPSVNLWAYTRSWRLGGGLLRALEKLRAEPNVALYASYDDSIKETPPKDWLLAVTGDLFAIGEEMPICPNQMTGGRITCATCRICIEGRSSIAFIPH